MTDKDMLHSDFVEQFDRGDLCIGINLLTVEFFRAITFIPWRKILSSKEFRKILSICIFAWLGAAFLGIIHHVFFLGLALCAQVLVCFFILNDAFAEAVLRDPLLFYWAVRERILVVFATAEEEVHNVKSENKIRRLLPLRGLEEEE